MQRSIYVKTRPPVVAFPPFVKSISKVLSTNSGLGPVVQTIWVNVKESIGQFIPSIVILVFPAVSKKFLPVIVI